MDSDTKINFTGKSMKATPKGYQHVILKQTGEHFTIIRPQTFVSGLMIGPMEINNIGKMIVKNWASGEVAKIKFKEKASFSSKGKHEIEGGVYASEAMMKMPKKKRKATYFIKGKWSESISVKERENENWRMIWKGTEFHPRC